MNFSYEERKNMFEYIKNLVKPEQEEIFRIIRKSKENYMENSNGIFFDLATVSDKTFFQIKEYMEFCLKNRQKEAERLEELEVMTNLLK